MKNHKSGFTAFIMLLLLGAAIPSSLNAQKMKRAENELLKTDMEFSEYSVEHGMNKAFFEFAHESVVLLKPEMMPIKGMEALKEFHAKIDDSNFSLSWKPEFARAAKSGDLGYTYGIWKMEGEDMNFEGTYVSIWLKSRDGKWKLVLDTGNGGLGKN